MVMIWKLLYVGCSGVQKQLAAAKGARKTLAMALISISTKYMDAKRVAEVELKHYHLVFPAFLTTEKCFVCLENHQNGDISFCSPCSLKKPFMVYCTDWFQYIGVLT
jgi:hypothetical protein